MTSKRMDSRREFLRQAAAGVVTAAGACSLVRPAFASEQPTEHPLVMISGNARERGHQYGRTFNDAIHDFLEREIYASFAGRPSTKEAMLRYADECTKAIGNYSPTIIDELEGMAEGTGLRLEEHVLITLHEELWHRGVLPRVEHCTAIAAGPPDTKEGGTYVGQTWDWMKSVYGLSSMLHWMRPDGPDLLAYAYPGLWVGAGLNSAGIALCWTSGDGLGIQGPRVGIPSYVLIAQMLYQETLQDAVEEARRATHAGWFTFVLGDAKGQLVNVEGTPRELAVEWHAGHLARVLFGSRQITRTPPGEPVSYHERCQRMYELLNQSRREIDVASLKHFFSSGCEIAHGGTIDAMIFDCTKRAAYLSRVAGAERRWKRFEFAR